jgi:hypothetical protein
MAATAEKIGSYYEIQIGTSQRAADQTEKFEYLTPDLWQLNRYSY